MKKAKSFSTVFIGALLIIIGIAASSVCSFAAEGDVDSGTYDGVPWRITEDYVLLIGEDGGDYTFTDRSSRDGAYYPWHAYCDSVKQVQILGTVHGNGSFCGMFNVFSACTSIDLEGFETSGVTNTRSMFGNCQNLKTVNLKGFDTSNVTDMRDMFANCGSLQALDVSRFNTSSATNMAGMFAGCSNLQTLNLSSFDTSGVTNLSGMFSNCVSLQTPNLSSFDTTSAEDVSYMFNGCYKFTNLDLSGFDLSNVKNMNYMLHLCRALRTFTTPNWSSSTATLPLFPIKMRNDITGEEYEQGSTIPAVDSTFFVASEITIDGREETTVSKNLFEIIAGKDTVLVIEDTDVQWTFDGQDIDPSNCKEIDVTTNIHKETGKSVGFANDDEVLVIDFADNGTLPGKAEVKVINDYIASQIGSGADHLMLSYVDGDGIILEDSNVSLEGKNAAVFKITHNSRFVLSKKRAAISLSGAKVIVSNRVYTGKAQKPAVKVVLKGRTLSSKYYKISGWANNKKVGTATVTVKGVSSSGYTGTAKGHFYINPKKAVISSVKAGKRKIVVTMKTKPSSTGGSYYKIQYRVAGSGSWKSTTTTGKSKTISKLRKGKKYQVRVTAIKGSRKGAVSAIKRSGKVK